MYARLTEWSPKFLIIFADNMNPRNGTINAMPITWRIEECVEFLADLLGALGLKRASLIGVSMVEDLLLGSQFELPNGSSGSYSSTARAWALRSLKVFYPIS